jgi:hypothetical protein
MGYAPRWASGIDPEDIDALEELGDRIATLAAHIHAATQRLLMLIAEFDRRRGWAPSGQASCAHWLAMRTGLDAGTAREKVRVAHALERLPQISAAMGKGELSFSQVRALTRAATPEDEAELLELAHGTSGARLERVLRAWKRGSRADEAERERERHASRTLSVFPDDEGMYVVQGRLHPEVGALLMRAIEAASDALYRKCPNATVPGPDRDREAAQRRADAIGLIAERALAAGFGADDETISGTQAERYQVLVHVDPDTLAADAEPALAELEDGTRVSAETSRRLACDASLVRITQAANGEVLDVGRKSRTVSSPLRRALEVRDRGCRFPHCGSRFTDAHHVKHWADGGETSLENCLLLCGHHHRLVHEEGWRIDWWGVGRAVFTSPRGETCFDGGWKPPPLPELPVEALIESNRLLGIEPDAWSACAQ